MTSSDFRPSLEADGRSREENASQPPPSGPRPSPPGAIALAILAGAMLVSQAAPVGVLAMVPVTLGWIDGFDARLTAAAALPWSRRMGLRCAATLLWWGGSWLAIHAHGGFPGTSWTLWGSTFALVLGAVAAGATAARTGLSAWVALLDFAVAGVSLLFSLVAYGHAPVLRPWVAVPVTILLALRTGALRWATGHRRRGDEDGKVAALAFVGWIGLGSVGFTMAPTVHVGMGLLTALVLTASALWVERRRRRAVVFFLRSSLAFCAATMLATASMLGG